MSGKDRVAIVTGAAGNGMGRSIALTLARQGIAVVVNYLTSSDSAAEIVAYIEGRGGRACTFQADITRPDQCQALVDAALDRFRQIDICIIGPGAGWHPEPAWFIKWAMFSPCRCILSTKATRGAFSLVTFLR